MNITTVGIDLAKNVFQVHGVDERGKVVLRKALKRAEVIKVFADLPKCLVGMEACGGAHYWARRLIGMGHTVKLMAPQFVKPYVKTNKNDARDAEAICEAVSRPNMRFVPVKDVEQQTILGLHRARQGFVVERTAQGNQMRGLLHELGIVIPKGIRYIDRHLPEILEDGENGLAQISRDLFSRLFDHFKLLGTQVKELESQIKAWHKKCSASMRIEAIPGIGALTASALVASIGEPTGRSLSQLRWRPGVAAPPFCCQTQEQPRFRRSDLQTAGLRSGQCFKSDEVKAVSPNNPMQRSGIDKLLGCGRSLLPHEQVCRARVLNCLRAVAE